VVGTSTWEWDNTNSECTMRFPRYRLRTLVVVMAWLTVVLGMGIRWAYPVPALSCVIRAEPTCVQGSVPKITVRLTNETESDIYLVGSLDGSEGTWRYPHCYFEVTGPDGAIADHFARGCGYTNRLREEDFFMVPPGGEFDPYQSIDDHGFFSAYLLSRHTFRATGKYHIRFVYSTLSGDIAQWRGQSAATNDKIVAMFSLVPKLAVKSNEIQVTVVAAGN
jgi:hypothetical protein